MELAGFSGIGALGGGNVTLRAGGDIGDAGTGVIVAVGGSGRVLPDGSLTQTGGGTLTVTAGGNIGTGGNEFVDLRGDTNVEADNFGYSTVSSFGWNSGDPRTLNSLTPYGSNAVDGGIFAPGDGNVNVRARENLVMGPLQNPGLVGVEQQTAVTGEDAQPGEQAVTWFSLWSNKTAVNMFAGGGDLTPFSQAASTGDPTDFLPPILNGIAPSGDIFLNVSGNGSQLQLPSPEGALNLLAGGTVVSIFNGEGPGRSAVHLVVRYRDALSSRVGDATLEPLWLQRSRHQLLEWGGRVHRFDRSQRL